jgi:hypothetical protein
MTIEELKSLLNKKLDDAGEINGGFALGWAKLCLKTYSDEDWEDYEQETGNKRPYLVPAPKSGLESMIDQATGLKEIQDRNFLNFLIYFIDGFMEELDEETRKEIVEELYDR